MDPGGESVGRQPFDHGLGIEKRAVDTLGRGAKHAMEADGVGHGGVLRGIDGTDLIPPKTWQPRDSED